MDLIVNYILLLRITSVFAMPSRIMNTTRIPKYALTTLMKNGLMTLLTSLLNLMKAIRSTSIVVKETCVTRLSTKG